MLLGILIVFEVLNRAATLPEKPGELWHTQRTIFESFSAKFPVDSPRLFDSATSQQQHSVFG